MSPPSNTAQSRSRLRPVKLSALQLIESPSRATGVVRKGELSLLDQNTQEEYRASIQSKLDDYNKDFALEVPFDRHVNRAQERASNILLLFRKLREGIVAASRIDSFALEVYETSACLSIIFWDSAQSKTILSQLPGLYDKISNTDESQASGHRTTMDFIILLHHLRLQYPAQSDFLTEVHKSKTSSQLREHAKAIAASLRRNNYAFLEKLTDLNEGGSLSLIIHQTHPNEPIFGYTIRALISQIRERAREEAWKGLKSAYRELTVDAASGDWLKRSLLIDPNEFGYERDQEIHAWLEKRLTQGEIALKEGTKSRFLIRKPAA